jgi:hypothetical protein
MNTTMKNTAYLINYRKPCLLLLLSIIMALSAFAQGEKQRVYFDCQHFTTGDGNKLVATTKARLGEDRKIIPVSGLEISFYLIADTLEQSIGTAVTNEEGKATMTVKENIGLVPGEKGEITFSARFDGNDELRKASTEVSYIPVSLELNFAMIDSVKTVVARAYRQGDEGKEWLDEDVEINFYVPGSFSLLKIGERTFSEGEASVPFPVTLPGDSTGNLTLIAKIERNEEFGIVEIAGIKDWGTPNVYEPPDKRRGLGDTDAPLWMVYTLIVLLSAVWFHYLYVFFVIYVIKRKGEAV